MFIKKNIIMFSFLFAFSVQASQPIPINTRTQPVLISTTTERNGTIKQVFVYADVDEGGNVVWMRETRFTDPDGTVTLEEWDGFSTKEEAEGRRSVIEENDGSDDSEGMGPRTESTMDFDPFGGIDESQQPKTPSRSSSQPEQSPYVQKIYVPDSQIPSVAQQIQDRLIFEFTGSMTPEEVIRLLKKNNSKKYDDVSLQKISEYDDVSLQKISEKISHALQDLDGLADVMYQVLQQQPNFSFRPKDNDQAKERYLKNYLHQYAGKYISDDLKQVLKNRFWYQKLKTNEFLKYANKLYANLMQDPTIDWFKDSKQSLNLEGVRKIVTNYLQSSTDPNIADIRKRLPFVIIKDNQKLLNDINEIIDWTAKKIVLPVNRPSEDLGEKLANRAKALRPWTNKQ